VALLRQTVRLITRAVPRGVTQITEAITITPAGITIILQYARLISRFIQIR